jgi:signal transduction histidine kinase
MRTISLRQAWIALIGGALLLGLVPGGIALDRRLAAELEQQARASLAMTPMILSDRNAGRSDALMMRAKELAETGGLARAVAAGRRGEALRLARATVTIPGQEPVLVGVDGRAWTEPAPDSSVVERTRGGAMPVVFGRSERGPFRLSLAPLHVDGRWVGAAGILSPIGPDAANELAALTRSSVVLLGPAGSVSASTLRTPPPVVLRDSAAAWSRDGQVHDASDPDGARYWVAVAPLGRAGEIAFLRSVSEELGLLPDLRRSALLALGIALVLALVLGGILAARMTRPVEALSVASRRLTAGDFSAPVPVSRIRELDQVGRAFTEMRARLEEKIRQLTAANEQLEDRQARLQALQSELIHRDRLAATGRIVTEVAHEIRNPVASVRNCLELIHRRLEEDSELREFSSMAIDELTRMHRLAEQMLDANRPLDPEADVCRPVEVARKVADLARLGRNGEGPELSVSGPAEARVAMSPDALKQVLLNLVENASEAIGDAGAGGSGSVDVLVTEPEDGSADGLVRIEVLDTGPGLDEATRARIFDPFFTTKDEVHGVGLGLFVAQGLVRRHGGDLQAFNRPEGGARFVIRLPIAGDPAASASAGKGESA